MNAPRPPRTLGAALAAQQAYARSIACDGSGPHLVTGPLYHAGAAMYAIYDHACGAPILGLSALGRAGRPALDRRARVHHTHLVPTMFVRLLKRLSEAERTAFRAPALHTVLHGAAPIAPDVKRRMIEWWGEVFYEYWGGTEGGVTTFVDSHDWLAHPGTVGRALPHFEVFAVDDTGKPLPPGAEGALYARTAPCPTFSPTTATCETAEPSSTPTRHCSAVTWGSVTPRAGCGSPTASRT